MFGRRRPQAGRARFFPAPPRATLPDGRVSEVVLAEYTVAERPPEKRARRAGSDLPPGKRSGFHFVIGLWPTSAGRRCHDGSGIA